MQRSKIKTVSRREVVSAVLSGFLFAPLAKPESLNVLWDLIVVGAGTAGLPAAITAARRGGRVLIIEQNRQIGGTLWISGGQMSAANTRVQASLGIRDSAQLHLDDIARISGGTVNLDLAGLAVKHAGGSVDWLMSNGLEITKEGPTTGTGHEPYGERRVHAPIERGLSTLRVLESMFANTAHELLLETTVEELVETPTGMVSGVVARRRDGTRLEFMARNVLLATGGHNGSPELFEQITGVPLFRRAAIATNTGAGINLARQVGGFTRGGENYLCDFGSIPLNFEWPSPEMARSVHHPDRRLPWEIYVNLNAERFVREDEPSVHKRELALLKQPQQRYWTIFDNSIRAESPPLVRWGPPSLSMLSSDELKGLFKTSPAFVSAESLEGLADKTGLNGSTLVDTIKRYNLAQETGGDWLGRQHMPRSISEPPFFAICHQGSTLVSFAGIAVDDQLRVVRENGASVPNLYAAGEVLGFGSLSGRAYCGGMGVTPAITFGRVLGGRIIPI